MELQNVPFTEARAREMVNISAGFRKMLKNKKAPLQDHIRISTIFLVVLSVILVVILAVGIINRSIFFLICSGIYMMLIFLYARSVVAMHKGIKMYMDLGSSGKRRTILEEDGITLEVEGKTTTKFLWESFKWVRIYKFNIFCVPKNDQFRDCLSLPIEHLVDLKGFLAEHNIELELIEGEAYGK